MKKFAIDIVLLPPDPVMNIALEWNRELCKGRPDNIVLNKTNYLPHITMAMGCVSESRLQRANEMLRTLANHHKMLELQISNVKSIGTASGNTVIALDIENNVGLTELHESIVKAFQTLLSQDATAGDMYDPPPIETSSIEWINRFIPHYCFEHFWPHITLGFGAPPSNFQPLSFQASRLAICHLGNYCTCRSILGESRLK
ncbi:MAG TPA: 2'-5' RNA ligase family protein [Chryseolinea sp.]|nr:2'-5' RNA ligase family protein [Chryseolinea sp.]